ncbi:MAG: propanediol utilization protein [Paracoccaceae bacterium]
MAGHFGEWLQGRLGPAEPVALVTVACPALAVHARSGQATMEPEPVGDICPAAFFAQLGIADPRPLEISCDMPLGGGAGASTARLVALARAGGFDGPPDMLARACLAVEGASDPLMYPEPDALLWASRSARVLQKLPRPPACEILGGFWGAPIPTDPEDMRFPDIADLAEDWLDAVAAGDLGKVAALASESALRCMAMRGPEDPMAALASDLGALGHLRAHTGSARGLIFSPGAAPDGVETALRAAGLTGVLRFRTGRAT